MVLVDWKRELPGEPGSRNRRKGRDQSEAVAAFVRGHFRAMQVWQIHVEMKIKTSVLSDTDLLDVGISDESSKLLALDA